MMTKGKDAPAIETPSSPWLKRDEAAAYLRVDASTLDRWRRERGLPSHRISGGGSYRYHKDELDQWVLAHPEE